MCCFLHFYAACGPDVSSSASITLYFALVDLEESYTIQGDISIIRVNSLLSIFSRSAKSRIKYFLI